MFEIALSLYGKEMAYPWLVKAQISRYGWNRYWTEKEDAIKRWEVIKKIYPERWLNFIQDTMRSNSREPWRNMTANFRTVRFVEYCLYLDKVSLASEVADKVINTTTHLISPLSLTPAKWLRRT